MFGSDRTRSLLAVLLASSAVAFPVAGFALQAQTPLQAQAPAQASPAVPPAQASAPAGTPPKPAAPKDARPEDVADSLVYHHRFQEAIAAYSTVTPKSAALWNKMGIAYQMMFNLPDAMRCYKQSLKINPHDASVFNNLGTVYESLKNYRQAGRMYRKAVQIDPRFAIAYKNLATSLMAQRKYSKGREADAQALALDPKIFEKSEDFLKVDNPASVHDRGAMNYYMAIDCARAGQTACALEHLRMALNQGFTSPGKVAADSNFAALSGDPGFQALLAEQSSK
jgi:tetratricopeptide (TPR) repeat protein